MYVKIIIALPVCRPSRLLRKMSSFFAVCSICWWYY